MENLVEMTSQNPNKALDKVKKDNTPTTELLEKLAKLPNESKTLLRGFLSLK